MPPVLQRQLGPEQQSLLFIFDEVGNLLKKALLL
jgi:hypothetical protein